MRASPTVPAPTHVELGPVAEQAMSRHPMEVFPVFRRWKCGFWRNIVYTGLWNTMLAAIFTLFWLMYEPHFTLARMLTLNLIFAQCIGYSIHFLFLLTDLLIPRSHRGALTVRAVYYAAVPILGVFAGYWIALGLLGFTQSQADLLSLRGFASVALGATLITGILLAVLIPRERAARAQLRIAQEEARAAAAECETTEARMQLLEAQIEPHFLYNTMAHVVSLIDTDPATAKGMLERLIALLRSTANAGNAGGTLQAQIDHLRAYLEILALRMGPRLTWTIDVASELAALPLPPMLLQPVVENAIKHGLETKVEGGKVALAAHRDGGSLVLTVTDTGMGFSERRNTASTGLGLANLRARLATLYGSAATVTIEDNAPAGARVTIALPLPVATQ